MLMAAAWCGIQAQTVKIMKGGEVVATFDASQFDSVVFAPEESPAPLDYIAGTYSAHRVVNLIEMPLPDPAVDDETEFTIASTGDNTISITFPSCFYAQMGMTLPGVTVSGIEVAEADGRYTFSKEISTTEESTGKTINVSVSGTINADKTFDITEKMKYGVMPFTLDIHYTTKE